VNKDAVDSLVAELRRLRPAIPIFLDREVLNAGMWWHSRILEALDASRKVVLIYSPDYFSSKMCQYEFQAAFLRHLYGTSDVLLPIYLHTATLPCPLDECIAFGDCV
jgi:hypothetical protein